VEDTQEYETFSWNANRIESYQQKVLDLLPMLEHCSYEMLFNTLAKAAKHVGMLRTRKTNGNKPWFDLDCVHAKRRLVKLADKVKRSSLDDIVKDYLIAKKNIKV